MTIGIVDVTETVKGQINSVRRKAMYQHTRVNWDSDPSSMKRCTIDKNAGKNTDGVVRRAYFRQDVTKDFDSRCRLIARYTHIEEHGLPYHTASAGWNHVKTPKTDPTNWYVTNLIKIYGEDRDGPIFCNRNQAVVIAFDVPYHFLKVNWRKMVHFDRLKASYSGRKGSKKSHDLVYNMSYFPARGGVPDKYADTFPEFTLHLGLKQVNDKPRKHAKKKKGPVDEAGLEAAQWLVQYTPKLYLFSDFDSPFESKGAEFAFLARFSSWEHRVITRGA
jgi:hypothetical protein